MNFTSLIQSLSNLGVQKSMSSQTSKRVMLINRLLILLALTGIIILTLLVFNNVLPATLTGVVILLTLLYLIAIFLSYKGNQLFGTYLMILGGNISIASTILLIGGDSYAQLMFLMLAGLPYLICDSKLGYFRLFLSALIIPLWVSSVSYANSHEPFFILEEEVKVYIRLTFILMTTTFSTFLLYHFNKLSEDQVRIIEDQSNRLEQKTKVLQQYNHMVSHDLKTPIANIEGFFNLLQIDLDTDDPDIKEYMSGIESSIQQANNTITEVTQVLKDLNTYGAIASVDLKKITEEVKLNLAQIIISSGTQISYDYSKCTHVQLTELDLKSILQNIISNAIKYTKSGIKPVIEISSNYKGDYIVLSIKDNGLGIDLPNNRLKLFGLHERIHTKNIEGTGVGLNMIKNIIESRGGKIVVESLPNIGSTFSVYIPYKELA